MNSKEMTPAEIEVVEKLLSNPREFRREYKALDEGLITRYMLLYPESQYLQNGAGDWIREVMSLDWDVTYLRDSISSNAEFEARMEKRKRRVAAVLTGITSVCVLALVLFISNEQQIWEQSQSIAIGEIVARAQEKDCVVERYVARNPNSGEWRVTDTVRCVPGAALKDTYMGEASVHYFPVSETYVGNLPKRKKLELHQMLLQ